MPASAAFRTTPLSFWRKALLALLLIVAADWLFWMQRPGSSVGAFALGWLLVLALARPGLLRDRRAAAALAAAVGFGAVLLDRPGLLACLLFGLSLTVAALSARIRGGEDVWRWLQRLTVHTVVSIAGPAMDAVRLSRLRRKPGPGAVALARLLILPVLGGLAFLGLFAAANPIVAGLLSRLRLPPLSAEQVGRAVFWAMLLIPVWGVMRPRWIRRVLPLPGEGARPLPGVGATSLILSLVVFNAVFALQNGLDLAFLWSGASLPGDVTLVRADMTQPDPASEADFTAVARRAADAAAPRLSVILDLPLDALLVNAPTETLEVVLTVLFENSRQVGATRAWVSARADGDDLVVRIRDDGPGVAQGDGERIFEPFFTTRRAEGGTGLGLSIARALLRAHRGALALRPGEAGAAFEMRLRRATTRA